jgi:hypothetical protein
LIRLSIAKEAEEEAFGGRDVSSLRRGSHIGAVVRWRRHVTGAITLRRQRTGVILVIRLGLGGAVRGNLRVRRGLGVVPRSILSVIRVILGRLGRLSVILWWSGIILARLSFVLGRLGFILGRLCVVLGWLGIVLGRLGIILGRLSIVLGRLGVILRGLNVLSFVLRRLGIILSSLVVSIVPLGGGGGVVLSRLHRFAGLAL